MKALGGFVAICLLWSLGLMGLLERLGPRSLVGYALLLVLAAPVVLFFVGTVEAIMGKRFRCISSAWDQMDEWKQGLLWFLLVASAIGVIALILWANWPKSVE
jgi:hypothetical protein